MDRRVFTPEEEAARAHLRAALAPYSSQSAAEQSAASQSEANPAEGAQSDAARSADSQSENVSTEDAPSQATQVALRGPAPKRSPGFPKKRLTREQICAKTRRVGIALRGM